MQTEELINMIDLYFDNELEKGKEPTLFTALAVNEEAREYFKNVNTFKTNIPFTLEEFPPDLEKNILYTVANTKMKNNFSLPKSRIFYFASYAMTVILMVLSLILFLQTNIYKNNIETVNEKINQQSEVILLLMNSLPAVEVSYIYENKAEVKANL